MLLLFDLCLVSATIELVMALPMAAYFHRVTTSGLFVNVLIVPALTLLLPAALLTVLALLTAPHIAWLPAAGSGGNAARGPRYRAHRKRMALERMAPSRPTDRRHIRVSRIAVARRMARPHA